MNNRPTDPPIKPEEDLFQTAAARSLLDSLLTESRLYTRSEDFAALLDFVVRLRNFAPFNAMLLHVQKPGLSYAASAGDWWLRFERRPKDGARPLIILWPFGPVALVYDVQDTEGKPLPEDVASFSARGEITQAKLLEFEPMLARKGIYWTFVDAGDRSAGQIQVVRRAKDDEKATEYRVHINRNHDTAVQFVTLAHELGHLFLGHIGPDKRLAVPKRPWLNHKSEELEAESVAYLVCERNGIRSKSQTYLSKFVETTTTVENLDVYQIMRAAGQVEALLALGSHTHFDRRAKVPASEPTGEPPNGQG